MNTTPSEKVQASVIGGLAAGAVLGVILAWLGNLPELAQFVSSTSATVGFIIHLVLSLVYGLVFAFVLGAMLNSMSKSLSLGLLYGVVLWVVMPLLIIPTLMGEALQLNMSAIIEGLPTLGGYVVFGLVLAAIYYGMTSTEGTSPAPATGKTSSETSDESSFAQMRAENERSEAQPSESEDSSSMEESNEMDESSSEGGTDNREMGQNQNDDSETEDSNEDQE